MQKGLPLLISGLLLIIFGLLAVYSVSIYESFTLTLNPAKFVEPTNYYYFRQQITSLVYIAIALFLVWKFPMNILKSHKFATFALIVALLLQILVFSPLGATYGGARGWLSIPGVPNIQPSEVFKLAYVFFLASWLVRRR
jgi:cell division protein FtsW